MNRILWINPVMTDGYNAVMGEALRESVRADTRVDVASLPGEGPNHLEFNAYEALIGPATLRVVRWGEAQGYDACVIGCFYDPLIRAARELTTNMTITAPAEASLALAGVFGERVSILVGRDKWIPEMQENVHRYGFSEKLASFRVLGMGVNDFQVDPDFTEQRILDESRAAMSEDRADAIVLGCTIEFGFYRQLQDQLGIPVIDATVAPIRYAEMLAELGASHSWRHSKVLGYNGPTEAERDALFEPLEPVLSPDPRT